MNKVNVCIYDCSHLTVGWHIIRSILVGGTSYRDRSNLEFHHIGNSSNMDDHWFGIEWSKVRRPLGTTAGSSKDSGVKSNHRKPDRLIQLKASGWNVRTTKLISGALALMMKIMNRASQVSYNTAVILSITKWCLSSSLLHGNYHSNGYQWRFS